MFQFTREFIINDLSGKLVEDSKGSFNGTDVAKTYELFGAVDGKSKIAWDDTLKTLMVENMCNIRQCDVASMYKNPYVEAQPEVVKAALGLTVEADSLYRLSIVLGQEGRVISTFNDQLPDHTRLVEVEAFAKTASDDVLKAMAENLAAMDFKMESPLVKLSGTGSDLTVEALDEYTRVLEIKLVKVNIPGPDENKTGYADYTEVCKISRKDIVWDGTDCIKGCVGQGTTKSILHNMRLLTAAHLDPFGTHGDERPVPGGLYNQYCVEMVTERRQIGHQVFGAIDKSLTTLIFYVHKDVCADFETALNKLKHDNVDVCDAFDSTKVESAQSAAEKIPADEHGTAIIIEPTNDNQ